MDKMDLALWLRKQKRGLGIEVVCEGVTVTLLHRNKLDKGGSKRREKSDGQ